MDSYRGVSLWLDQFPGSLAPRAHLPGDISCDIAIVGAGFTGLWTAYYLQQRDPSAKIVLIEREIAGFGASGRNGGWCSALFPTSFERLAAETSAAAAVAMRDTMRGAIDEVGTVAAELGIDCDFAHGGTVVFARSQAHEVRGQAEVAAAHSPNDDDLRWLSASETLQIAQVSGALGASFTPHCSALDPAKLVRGLADVVTDRGAVMYENTAAIDIAPHRVVTSRGVVSAASVIRATEAFTSDLPGHRRDSVPVYSLIIATEQLPDRILGQIGLDSRATFADYGNLVCYGQRTADGRIVFGGRGAPYHFGSSTEAKNDRDGRVFSRLREQIIDMFPVLADAEFTHAWGGAVAATRDWHASVDYNPATGLGHAGGYVGDGVSTTNVAGRTLADLVTGTASDLVGLPWVGHRSRRWEPEPLRWLGINAGIAVMTAADRMEARTGKPSRAAALFSRLLGQ